jgi:hypothetical protein
MNIRSRRETEAITGAKKHYQELEQKHRHTAEAEAETKAEGGAAV